MNNHKVALITGSSRGIGKGMVEALLEKEWNVYGISRKRLKIKNKDKFNWIQADLGEFDKYADIVKKIKEPLDVVVLNAGVCEVKNIVEIDEKHIDFVMGLNFKSQVLLLKYLDRYITKKTKVIFISSDSAKAYFLGFSIYSASKAALNALAQTYRMEKGCEIYSLLPGSIDTDLSRTVDYDKDKSLFKKYLKVDDIVSVFLSLLDNKFQSGNEIIIVNNYVAEELKNIVDTVKIVNVDKMTG